MKSKKSTALVTGAAVRIGRAISLRLAALGYDILMHYHKSRKEAEAAARLVERTGVRATLIPCDFNDPAAVQSMMKDTLRKFPQTSLLINNASIFTKSSFSKETLQNWDAQFNINLKAPFLLMQEFARHVKNGHIINMIDTKVTHNKTEHLAYLLSKKSLQDLTKIAALTLAPRIRVNAIAPGLILPPEGENDEYLKRRAQGIPLKMKGKPEYILDSVEFLIKNEFLTGQIIFNDGGEHLLSS